MSGLPDGYLKIENVVASTKVNDKLDLLVLAAQIPGAEYNKQRKQRFPGVVLRMQNPNIAVLLLGS